MMSVHSGDQITSGVRMPNSRRISPALDGKSVLAALRRHGGDRMFGGAKVTSCCVDRVHFGSRIGVVIDYSVHVVEPGGSSSEVRIFGQLPWTDVDAAVSRAQKKLSRQKQDGGGEPPNVMQIPEWGLLLRRPGHDERISGLWLLKPREQWSGHVVDDETAELSRRFDRATLLTHRFAKRAVLRLAHGRKDDTPASAIVKFYRRGSTAAQPTAAVHRRLCEELSRLGGDIAAPRVDTVFPGMAGILMQDVAGVPLSALPGDERTAAMALAGVALARLHTTTVAGLVDYGIDDEIRLLRNWVEFTSGLDPASGATFADKFRSVEQALLRCGRRQPRPIHRDFHERQLISGSGSATLIDFDTVRLGDPAQDIGNFLAHLKLAEHVSGEHGDSARANFLDGYNSASVGEKAGTANIIAHERATLLRLALINWFNERSRHAAAALLDGI